MIAETAIKLTNAHCLKEDEQMQDLGRFICRIRKNRKITQKELADRAGVGLMTIVCLENGKRQNPRIDTLLLILHALGYDLQIETMKEKLK